MTEPATWHPWPVVGRRSAVQALVDRATSPTAPGVVLTGPAGIGKTALASAFATAIQDEGLPIRRLVATATNAKVPFAVMAPLATVGDGGHDPAEIERVVRSLVTSPAGRLVLTVDDIPLLDPHSADLIATLVRDGVVVLVGTARSTMKLPAAFDALAVEGFVVHQEVDPLQRGQVVEAAEAALGGPMAPASQDLLWRLSAGVALHARELVQTNLAAGHLVRSAEGWGFDDRPVAPSMLIDLVASRFTTLDDADQRAFEVLAVAEPIPLEGAIDIAGLDLLEVLESAELLRVDTSGAVPLVRLGHPLYGEAIEASIGPLRRRAAAERAIETLDAHGGDDPDIGLRTACLCMDHGLPLTPAHAVAAARRALALVDPALAVRLIEASPEQRSYDARFTLGAALSALGRHDDADVVLHEAFEAAETDEQRARAISRRGNNLGTGAGRFRDSAALLEEGLASLTDRRWQSFVAADLAYVNMWMGRIDHPDEVDDPEAPPKPEAVRANECLVGAVIAVMQGELAMAEKLVHEGLPLAAALADTVPTARELMTLSRFLALAFGGDHLGAESVVEAELERATADSEGAPGTWLAVRAMQRFIDGDLTRAAADAAEAASRLELVDISGLRPLAQAVRATSLVQQGDLDGGAAVAAQVDPAWREETKVKIVLAQCRAWQAAMTGRTSEAAVIATDAGAAGLAANHVPMGAIAAYDAVRLGSPQLALPILRDAATRWEGDLARALLEHAEALAADDADRLLRLAPILPELGFTLAGAEAAAQAARAYELSGRTADARRAEFLAATITEPIGQPRSPTLGSPKGLTKRERQVADLAATGESSREIAARLSISIRTVDNHLAAIYRKLGVSTRAELPRPSAPMSHRD